MDEKKGAKILVVGDDGDVLSLLSQTLGREGHQVKTARDAFDGLRQAYTLQPNLIVLDILMPGLDGWDMLRRVRELTDVPVMILSAVGDEEAIVRALDLGADDYVVKPFRLEELRARIQAVLRRASLPPTDGRYDLRFDGGRLAVDPAAQRVTVRDQVVDLTPTEYKLFLYLAYNAGRLLTHNQIIDAVWGTGYEQSTSTVKVNIRRLRQKIEADPRRPRYILTQRGAGYLLAKL